MVERKQHVVRLLDEKGVKRTRKMVKGCSDLRIAVAFWGRGRSEDAAPDGCQAGPNNLQSGIWRLQSERGSEASYRVSEGLLVLFRDFCGFTFHGKYFLILTAEVLDTGPTAWKRGD